MRSSQSESSIGIPVNHVKLDEQNLEVDSVLVGLANFKAVLVISMIGKI